MGSGGILLEFLKDFQDFRVVLRIFGGFFKFWPVVLRILKDFSRIFQGFFKIFLGSGVILSGSLKDFSNCFEDFEGFVKDFWAIISIKYLVGG